MNDFVEIRHYIAIIARRWWILLLGVVIGVAIGYGVSQRMPLIYQASASLIVGQSIQSESLDSRDILTSQLLAQTYAEVARRQPILQSVVDKLELNITWQQLRRKVSVKPLEGTQLLEVSVEHQSPEKAQAIADEVTRQLVLLTPNAQPTRGIKATNDFVRDRLAILQARIEQHQIRITALEQIMSSMGNFAGLESIQDEIDTRERFIADWEDNFSRLLTFMRSEKPSNILTVIEEAYVKTTPVRPRVQLNILVAGAAGLFLALAIVFILEHLDQSFKTTEELNRALNLTPLGSIVQMTSKTHRDSLISFQGLSSPVSEAYRMIRTNLQFMSVDRPFKVIMVTSAVPGEGKSTTAANLGIVMAQAGLETVIVDADLRRPMQHQIFQLIAGEGLTDAIRNPDIDIGNCLSPTEFERLRVLLSGPLPPNPSEILGSHQMERLLGSLKELADIVILDSSPAAIVTDAAVLSNKVDGVVMVVRAGRTRPDVVKQAVTILRQAGANFLGVALNGVSTKQGKYPYGSDQSVGNTSKPRRLPIRGLSMFSSAGKQPK